MGHILPKERFEKDESSGSQIFKCIGITWELVKHRRLGLTPRVSDSVGLAQGRRMHISNKFPGDAVTDGSGTQP